MTFDPSHDGAPGGGPGATSTIRLGAGFVPSSLPPTGDTPADLRPPPVWSLPWADLGTPCQPHEGACDPDGWPLDLDGYGMPAAYTHTRVWAKTHGAPPYGLIPEPACGARDCTNPAHLVLRRAWAVRPGVCQRCQKQPIRHEGGRSGLAWCARCWEDVTGFLSRTNARRTRVSLPYGVARPPDQAPPPPAPVVDCLHSGDRVPTRVNPCGRYDLEHVSRAAELGVCCVRLDQGLTADRAGNLLAAELGAAPPWIGDPFTPTDDDVPVGAW